MTQGDGIDAIQRIDRAMPSPGPGEVLVRMKALALNYRDLLVIRGEGVWKPRVPAWDRAHHAGSLN